MALPRLAPFLLPQHQAAADEGVTQIVDSYLPMAAASDDIKLGRDPAENRPDTLIMKRTASLLGQEERRDCIGRAVSGPCAKIGVQSLGRA